MPLPALVQKHALNAVTVAPVRARHLATRPQPGAPRRARLHLRRRPPGRDRLEGPAPSHPARLPHARRRRRRVGLRLAGRVGLASRWPLPWRAACCSPTPSSCSGTSPRSSPACSCSASATCGSPPSSGCCSAGTGWSTCSTAPSPDTSSPCCSPSRMSIHQRKLLVRYSFGPPLIAGALAVVLIQALSHELAPPRPLDAFINVDEMLGRSRPQAVGMMRSVVLGGLATVVLAACSGLVRVGGRAVRSAGRAGEDHRRPRRRWWLLRPRGASHRCRRDGVPTGVPGERARALRGRALLTTILVTIWLLAPSSER